MKNDTVQKWTEFLACACVALLMAAGPACGPRNALKRYAVRGSVTHAGRPVPDGNVAFEPDAAAGNKGPSSNGRIEGGRYLIERARGHVGGPHVIRLSGFEPIPTAKDGALAAKTLFLDHEIRVDLPKADSTQDIEVPSAPRK